MLFLTPNKHINQNTTVKCIWVYVRSGMEREAGRRSCPAQGLSHHSAGIRVSGEAAWDGIGKGLEHKHPALLWARGQHTGRGGRHQADPGEKSSPGNSWSHSISRRSGPTAVGMRFEFPSICWTSGSLFSIKNKWAVLAPSRTLLFRLLFCTAYWTDLEGKRNWLWQLECFGVLAMWQNFLMRWMRVMPFPLLFSSTQASVSISFWIIWKWHLE